MKCVSCVVSSCVIAMGIVPNLAAATMETVVVGNSGNAADMRPFSRPGGVDYVYRIGKFEVTNAQYAEFLNAKAANDPLELYNPLTQPSPQAGITRTGNVGSFQYVVEEHMDDKPVVLIDYFSALRFANWLNNGQGDGDTETGAYTLHGATPVPSNYLSVVRNAAARWVVPNESEWYKAAYYDPTLNNGMGAYWDYATRTSGYFSGERPELAVANDQGDIVNSGPNVANYLRGADWNGEDGNVTTVGGAGPLSESYYGTADQSGNVSEWLEADLGGARFLERGGSWPQAAGFLSVFGTPPSGRDFTGSIVTGFRVALLPEPDALKLLAFGIVLVLPRRFEGLACRETGAAPNARGTALARPGSGTYRATDASTRRQLARGGV